MPEPVPACAHLSALVAARTGFALPPETARGMAQSVAALLRAAPPGPAGPFADGVEAHGAALQRLRER